MSKEVKRLNQLTPESFVPMPDYEDQARWTASGNGVFSVTSALKAIRGRKPAAECYKLVWGKNHIPRCSFIFGYFVKEDWQ